MIIGKHAIRRYKQRIGKRTASRERIKNEIKSQIEKHTINRYTINHLGHYHIETHKFIAVCDKNRVITIMSK